MSIIGIHHLTLLVDDKDRAAAFYGQILGLREKIRPDFDFPGLFYHCGDNQEIHIIVASRPMTREDLFITFKGDEITRRWIHRHAAFKVLDFESVSRRLAENNIEILFSPDELGPDDEQSRATIEGWKAMYGTVPTFCKDPFNNVLELIPWDGCI